MADRTREEIQQGIDALEKLRGEKNIFFLM